VPKGNGVNDFNEFVNRICKELPVGFDIEIRLENGYGGVVMNCPEYAAFEICDDFIGDTLYDQLINALGYAKEEFENNAPDIETVSVQSQDNESDGNKLIGNAYPQLHDEGCQ
jgi:hypothetical protein